MRAMTRLIPGLPDTTCPAGILACDAEGLTIGVENGKTTIKPEQCVRAFETILAMEQYSNGMVYASQAATEALKQINWPSCARDPGRNRITSRLA